MLNDFFGIQIEDNQLVSLPVILPAIKPYPQELPMFLLRLASEVDYTNEINCI